MAPGKSTLAQVLAGHPAYAVTGGTVTYLGQDLLAMPPEERARAGLFLAFQYPVEIPGVNNAYFLKAAVNEKRARQGLEELDAMEFLELLEKKLALVEMDRSFVNRPVNEGFSGGEKKRNEILQMAVLEPRLAILDETDSGLDIDALKIVAAGVNRLRRPDNAMIVVTHYQRMLEYVEPDKVHVLFDGRIVKSGEQGAGAGAGAQGLRLDPRRGRCRRAGRGVDVSTVVALRDQEHYLTEFERLERRGAQGTPSWLAARRRSAMARFAELGFPTTRDEDWRYTNLAPLVAMAFRPDEHITRDELPAGAAEQLSSLDLDWPRLVFVNGRFSPRALVEDAAAGGVRVSSLAEALAHDGVLVERHLARHAAWETNAFAALNTAFVEDGAFLHVPADASLPMPIELLFLATAPGALVQPRVLIVAGAGSRCRGGRALRGLHR